MLVFFSSRRRHTRSKRDWSSDVCSSDHGRAEPRFEAKQFAIHRPAFGERPCSPVPFLEHGRCIKCRSGKRRVGKKCISRRTSNFLSEKIVLTCVTPPSSSTIL